MFRWICAAACCCLAALPANAAPEFADVFVGGEGGYHTYRIPAVATTTQGTVLAFAEGRIALGDHASNDIVLRRSEDNGKTWGAVLVVATAGDDALNNPCVVILRPSGRILLAFQHYPEKSDEREVEPGLTGDNICRNYLVHSDDDGKSWSVRRDITAQTKRPTHVTSMASGPGNGIQLQHGPHAGRVVFPMNEGPWGVWRIYAIYSDDGGDTWHYGDVVPNGKEGGGNEVLMAELSGGRVRLNARSADGEMIRKTAISNDGGATWSPLESVPALLEPRCNAGYFRVGDPALGAKSPLLYSGPDSKEAREKGTLHVSLDEGETWTIKKTLVPGLFAYSALTELENGQVGCLFETGEKSAYEGIRMATFTLDWLLDNK